MLDTRNIYIDTEIFVANNFFHNENLRRIQEFGYLKTINIYMSEITKAEIQKNIKEDLMNAVTEINRFRQIISNKGKILKNIEKFKPYFDLPKIELELNFAELNERLEEFIQEAKVEIIPFELANINDVVSNYLTEKPPFSGGRKKYEFPDAIVISSLQHWCKKNKTSIYFISADPDFKNLKLPEINVIPNIKVLLDKINKQYSHDESEWILGIFESRSKEIIKKINIKFKEELEDFMMYDIEISNISVHNIELSEPSIVENNESLGEYILQLDFDITFSADITRDDYSFASYDKEDDRYYNIDEIKSNYELSFTQSAEISIEAYFEERDEEEPVIKCTYVSIPTEYQIENKLDNNDLY